MKNKKIVNLVIFILYFFIAIFLINSLKNILSFKELIVIILFLTIVEFLFIYLIKNNILVFISYPCIFLILILLLIFNIKSTNLFSFISDVVTDKNIVDNYRVITLRGKYNSVEELENKKIGYTKDTIGFNNLTIKFQSICYDDFKNLIDDLVSEKIDAAIILYDQYIDLDYNKYEIIYKFEFLEEVVPVSQNAMDKTSLIYISTTDNYETGKSDVNVVLGLNNITKQMLLILIPRDYYVLLPSKGENDKIAHAGIYGINESIKAVESLLKNPIDYYIKLDFSSLETLIDKIDGIIVESDYEFISSGIKFKKGANELSGTEALIFARERKGLIGGDRTQGVNQEKVIESAIKKVLSDNNYFKVLTELKNLIKTNIPENDILKLIKNQIAYNYKWNMTKYMLDGFDNYEYVYSYKCCKLNVIEPDMTTVNEAITLIEYLKTNGIFN